MISDAIAAAGLLTALIGLGMYWRQRILLARVSARMREDMERLYADCREQTKILDDACLAREQNMQATLEMLRDGRLGLPVRSRALSLLRSGMSAESAARELGLAQSELRLLATISTVLPPRNSPR